LKALDLVKQTKVAQILNNDDKRRSKHIRGPSGDNSFENSNTTATTVGANDVNFILSESMIVYYIYIYILFAGKSQSTVLNR